MIPVILNQVRRWRAKVVVSHLQIHGIGVMAQPRKHSHRVVEDETPTLHALIQPARPVFLLLDRDRKRLTSAIVHGINDSHVELVGVFCKVMGAGHACNESSSAANARCVGAVPNSPAAPAPTIKTLFFSVFSILGAILKRVEEAVRDCNKGSEDWRIR